MLPASAQEYDTSKCLVDINPFPESQLCLLVEGNNEPVVVTIPKQIAAYIFIEGGQFVLIFAAIRTVVIPFLRNLEAAQDWPIIGSMLAKTDLDDKIIAAKKILTGVPEIKGISKKELNIAAKSIAKEDPTLPSRLIEDAHGKEKLIEVVREKTHSTSLAAQVIPPATPFSNESFLQQKRKEAIIADIEAISIALGNYKQTEQSRSLTPQESQHYDSLKWALKDKQSQLEEINNGK